MVFCLPAPIPRPESGVFKVRSLSLGSSLPHWPGSYNITFEHAEEAKMRAVDWIPGILPFVGVSKGSDGDLRSEGWHLENAQKEIFCLPS